MRLPADPAQSRLALVAAALARGESVIERLSEGPGDRRADCRARRRGRPYRPRRQPLARTGARPARSARAARAAAPRRGRRRRAAARRPVRQPVLRNAFYRHRGRRRRSHAGLSRRQWRAGQAAAAATRRFGGPVFAVPLDLALSAAARELALPLLLQALLGPGRSRLRLPAGAPDPGEALLALFGARFASSDRPRGARNRDRGPAPRSRAQALSVPGDAGARRLSGWSRR